VSAASRAEFIFPARLATSSKNSENFISEVHDKEPSCGLFVMYRPVALWLCALSTRVVNLIPDMVRRTKVVQKNNVMTLDDHPL
jgi:hypothetical protein